MWTTLANLSSPPVWIIPPLLSSSIFTLAFLPEFVLSLPLPAMMISVVALEIIVTLLASIIFCVWTPGGVAQPRPVHDI